MTRKKVDSVRLTGRISENTSSKEDVEFVEKKLRQGFSQAVIIRQAIEIYRRYEERDFFNENPKPLKVDGNSQKNKEDDSKNKENIAGLDSKLKSGEFF